MKKLRLEVSDLTVESFETREDGPKRRGTVIGNVLYTDIRYCNSAQPCYTDNEPECATAWYGCNSAQCSRYPCDTIEGSGCA